MSASEFGVVAGVVLEGIEYIPAIHRRGPMLEKVGFLVLVLSLVADWHFQSQINERHTNALISANDRIAALRSGANQLTKDAATANRHAADAESRAATALTELIVVTTPRHIAVWDPAVESLKAFAGQLVFIQSVDEAEPNEVAHELMGAVSVQSAGRRSLYPKLRVAALP